MARPKVILFDVNETLLDLQPMKEGIGKLLGAGPDAAVLWFTTLLQHSLVGTVAGKYLDFAEVGAACLRMAASNHGVELSENEAQKAVAPMRSLPPHPEVPGALAALARTRLRLVALTNSVQPVAEAQLASAGLSGLLRGRAFRRWHWPP